MKLYADDTSLFTVVYDTHHAAEDLSNDLRSIEGRAFKWRMSFNPDPMKQAVELIFSRSTLQQTIFLSILLVYRLQEFMSINTSGLY